MPRRSLPLLLIAVASLGAQSPTYHVAADTLRYAISNPYRLYWLRGADTIGPWQHERTVETHAWRGPAQQPEVVVRSVTLDVNRRTMSDTFTLAPSGRVLAVDHHSPNSAERIDLLLNLPATTWKAGTTWHDSVGGSKQDPSGTGHFRLVRSYRVTGFADTLGARGAALVEATGTVAYRVGFWLDSAAGRAAWMDVSGPVTEHFVFDVANGRLLNRSWDMDLHGSGVGPDRPDTVPAGLRSSEDMRLDDSPRTRFLLDPLPGKDSAVSLDSAGNGAILLHVVDRSPDHVTSSMTRNDGLVGRARMTFSRTTPMEYHATWADSAGLESQAIVVTRDSLRAHYDSGDTAVAVADAERWGVADYAMQEFLAPMLLALPRDGTRHTIAIWRPTGRHWDRGTASAVDRAGAVVVTMQLGSDRPNILLYTPDGDYLYGENSDPTGARRIPLNAERQAAVRRVIAASRP